MWISFFIVWMFASVSSSSLNLVKWLCKYYVLSVRSECWGWWRQCMRVELIFLTKLGKFRRNHMKVAVMCFRILSTIVLLFSEAGREPFIFISQCISYANVYRIMTSYNGHLSLIHNIVVTTCRNFYICVLLKKCPCSMKRQSWTPSGNTHEIFVCKTWMAWINQNALW